MEKVQDAKHWIDRNLWLIIAAGMGVYSGYLTGQTTNEQRILALENYVAKHDAKLNSRSRFMSCAIRNIDRLQEQTGTSSACPLTVED